MNELRNEKTEEVRIEALLKQAGLRITPPASLMNDVRAAVHDDWQRLVAERTRQRRVRWLAAAASVGAIALATTTAIVTTTDATEMAVAMRVDGSVTRDAGLLSAPKALSTDSRVYVGDEIVTGPDGRVAFVAADGIELRIDTGTHVRLVDPSRVMLEQGAVYVDSDRSADRVGTTFVVATDQATVRHIGTQYQVRATGGAIQVSVREGRVVIDSHGALHEGRAGERLAIADNGSVARSTVAAHDLEWQWVYSIAPPFDIENRSLDEFLEWFSRETGHQIAFATPQLAQTSGATMLRGSIEGLEPRAALEAVLATSNLMLTETNAGKLIVQARE